MTVNINKIRLGLSNRRRKTPPLGNRTAAALTLIVLYVVSCLAGLGGVSPHHVVVHESLATEEGEAAGATQHTANHVLRGFLQPMTNGVLEHLIPHHQACREPLRD